MPPAPNATELESVPVNVSVLLAVSVLPSAIVSVLPVAGAVIATLLMLVADATPRVGVTSVGLLENTTVLEPVSSVSAPAKFADVGVAKNVATPVPRPEMPVLTGSPVQLVRVPELGVPSAGVTSVGLFANTSAPVPVSSVTALARLALEGVAKNVPTFAPRPLKLLTV